MLVILSDFLSGRGGAEDGGSTEVPTLGSEQFAVSLFEFEEQ